MVKQRIPGFQLIRQFVQLLFNQFLAFLYFLVFLNFDIIIQIGHAQPPEPWQLLLDKPHSMPVKILRPKDLTLYIHHGQQYELQHHQPDSHIVVFVVLRVFDQLEP